MSQREFLRSLPTPPMVWLLLALSFTAARTLRLVIAVNQLLSGPTSKCWKHMLGFDSSSNTPDVFLEVQASTHGIR